MQVIDAIEFILPLVFLSEIGDGLNGVCGGKHDHSLPPNLPIPQCYTPANMEGCGFTRVAGPLLQCLVEWPL